MTEQVENRINKDMAIENDILIIMDETAINRSTASNKCRVNTLPLPTDTRID